MEEEKVPNFKAKEPEIFMALPHFRRRIACLGGHEGLNMKKFFSAPSLWFLDKGRTIGGPNFWARPYAPKRTVVGWEHRQPQREMSRFFPVNNRA